MSTLVKVRLGELVTDYCNGLHFPINDIIDDLQENVKGYTEKHMLNLRVIFCQICRKAA